MERRAFRILRARPHGHVAAVLGTMSKLGLAELLLTRAHRKCQPALDRLQERFGLGRVVLVGDREMLTRARITEELKPRRVEWITSLRSPTIRMLMADDGPLQLSLFDEQDLAEITESIPKLVETRSDLRTLRLRHESGYRDG